MSRDLERLFPWLLIIIGLVLLISAASKVDNPFDDTRQRTPTEQTTP